MSSGEHLGLGYSLLVKRYRLYIDESGDHGHNNLDTIGGKYLGLMGLMIESEEYRTSFHPQLEALKQECIPHDPDRLVILHRREIMNATGPFKTFQDINVRSHFNKRCLAFVSDQRFTIMAVVLDKTRHLSAYGHAAFHPYHYCMTTLLELYCGLLRRLAAKGDVLAESRGKREDGELKKAYDFLVDSGTQFHGPGFFQDVLTGTELKTAKKEANISGLQLADLLAHPSKHDVLAEFARTENQLGSFGLQLRKAMRGHYNRNSLDERLKGYGMVLL